MGRQGPQRLGSDLGLQRLCHRGRGESLNFMSFRPSAVMPRQFSHRPSSEVRDASPQADPQFNGYNRSAGVSMNYGHLLTTEHW